MALGRPLRKTRETKDDVEQETWRFGQPPGRVTFVTFAGPKLMRVRDTYAGMGGWWPRSPVRTTETFASP